MTGFFWLNPGGLWALAALALVTAIYLFYRRHRPLPVTGLFLWGVPGRTGAGGGKLDRPLASRSFLLDLLAAALLALAVAGPSFRAPSGMRLVVVMDDSFAMRAGDCRARVLETVEKALAEAEARGGSAAVMLAGERPSLLSAMDAPRADAMAELSRHKPAASDGDLAAAVVLASDLFGHGLDIRIISNRELDIPAHPDDRVTRHVLAGYGGNVAFGNAWRVAGETEEEGERLIFSVVNHSRSPVDTVLALESIAADGRREAVRSDSVRLDADATQHREISLDGLAGRTVTLRLDVLPEADVIAEDSLLYLPPAPSLSVGYALDGLGDAAASFFRKGLDAAGCVETALGASPDLIVSSRVNPPAAPLLLRVVPPARPGVFNPPYVVDLSAPLCRDVDLSVVPWVIADHVGAKEPAAVFIQAGGMPLYWLERDGSLNLNLVPDRSLIVREPAWPALTANLRAYAAERKPGLRETAYRPGGTFRYHAPDAEEDSVLTLSGPEGEAVTGAAGREFALPMEAGLYRLETAGGAVEELSVLPLYGKAADTTRLAERDAVAVSGRSGDDADRGVIDFTWLALGLGAAAFGLNWRMEKRGHD